MNSSLLWQIAATFGGLSLVAIGGANAVVPEIHRQVVTTLAWMSDATFAHLFAIAQVAPGPNILVVSLIGWHLAGALGLVIATLAMIVPSCCLAFGVGRLVSRGGPASWLRIVQDGLIPIAVGLILASGWVMARAAASSRLAVAITIGTSIFVVASGRTPLWALFAGTIISVAAARFTLVL
jgi:chromate transporter